MSNGKFTTFTTARLIIRPTTREDAAFLLELVNTPKWLANIGDRQVRSLADAEAYIAQKITPQLIRLGYSSYTLIRKIDQAKIGVCGLYDREGFAGIDLGFALLPAFEQQGYACEAASRVMQAAYEDFGIQELSAITTQHNSASQKLLAKLGFTLCGTIQLTPDDEELLKYSAVKSGLDLCKHQPLN